MIDDTARLPFLWRRGSAKRKIWRAMFTARVNLWIAVDTPPVTAMPGTSKRKRNLERLI